MLIKSLLSVFLLLGCGACGYHLEGRQAAATEPPRLYIELFANETHRAFANDVLTVQIIERFARSPLFSIVENPDQADLLLGGAITLYDTAPVAYSQADTISAYKADLAIRSTLRRPGAVREMVWRETLSTSQDYTGNNPDLVMQQSAERLANDLYVQVSDALCWNGGK
ncbi:MAG: LPS assembly lipoprotein LptE [Desulfuromonadales bacterium]|nr:LPS assembly lipoprotein LptE [Desulfuromonadales bacterium]